MYQTHWFCHQRAKKHALNVPKNYEFSSAWTIMAATDVLNTTINCVYPPCNGQTDLAYTTLTTYYNPANVWPHRTISIMWTSTSLFRKGFWTPNHCVPLLYATHETFHPTSYSSPVLICRHHAQLFNLSQRRPWIQEARNLLHVIWKSRNVIHCFVWILWEFSQTHFQQKNIH